MVDDKTEDAVGALSLSSPFLILNYFSSVTIIIPVHRTAGAGRITDPLSHESPGGRAHTMGSRRERMYVISL